MKKKPAKKISSKAAKPKAKPKKALKPKPKKAAKPKKAPKPKSKTDLRNQVIDLNCDMGEGFGNEASILPFISSANIACGYHAGDEKIMCETIKLASKHRVAIGAHPSFLDKENFGRKHFDLTPEEIYELIIQQLLLFNDVAFTCDSSIQHIKPHGALYNLSATNKKVAKSIAQAVKDFDDTLIIFGLSGSHSVREAKALGLQTANEVFADRTYQDDGSLTPRTEKNALIDDVDIVVRQALQFVKSGTVHTASGKEIKLKADTICIHGDHANAGLFAKQLNKAFKENQIQIIPNQLR